MIYGIIDVREWQTAVNLETGKKTSADHKLFDMAKDIIKKNYYPGDLKLEGIEWVTDKAIEINEAYNPGFMFLSYSQPYFMSRFTEISCEEWDKYLMFLFNNIKNFLNETPFEPVIVGLGGMMPLKGNIDLSNLNAIAIGGGTFAGLFDVTFEDLTYLETIPEVERIVSKKDFIEEFGGSPLFVERFPDYLVEAKKGFRFRSYGNSTRTDYKISAKDKFIPIHTNLGEITSMVEVKKLIKKNISKQKVALIVIEGIGINDFRLPYQKCSNKYKWYTYEQAENHYFTLLTGKHFQYNDYPASYEYYLEDNNKKKFPYSGHYTDFPSQTIGKSINVKSAAVGSRGVLTHMASGADISIECFSRELYNYGTMAIINTKSG